jgi:GNAT superfamily N-acetyltransferase
MKIRRAMPEDAEAISALIKSVAHYFTVHPEGLGAEGFLKTIEPAATCANISAPNFHYAVGHIDQQLVGIVALRDTTHLYHLFVDQAFQKQGLSRQLWLHAKEASIAAGNHLGITVNASVYAVPVYERFGFAATGSRVETHGIAFLPMALRF